MSGKVRVLLVVAGLLAAGSVPAAAEIGGEPSNDYKRCDRFSRPCGKPFVVAEGKQFGGRREIVGLERGIGACLSFEVVGSPLPIQAFPCDESASPVPDKKPYRVTYKGGIELGKKKWTEIGGVLRPDVDRLVATYRRRGERKRQVAVTNQIERKLARRIGFQSRVGAFDLGIAGKVSGRKSKLRLKAYDARGKLIRK